TDPTTLIITAAGLAAIGNEPETADRCDKRPPRRKKASRAEKVAKRPARGRVGDTGGKSKQDTVIALLRRGNGASIEEMMAATGWLAHSVRGFMSGALKKRLGLEVVSEKDAKTDERRYYVAALRKNVG